METTFINIILRICTENRDNEIPTFLNSGKCPMEKQSRLDNEDLLVVCQIGPISKSIRRVLCRSGSGFANSSTLGKRIGRAAAMTMLRCAACPVKVHGWLVTKNCIKF